MSKYNLDSDAVEDIKINYHLFPRKHFSAKYNIPISQVYYIGTKTGVRITETARNNEQNIVNEYTNGSPIRHIAKKFHLDRDSIRAILVKNKVELTSQSSWNKKYTWDESYFEKIDSHKKAYWLGFIYADGNIRIKEKKYKLFQISLKDRSPIYDFLRDIKSSHLVYSDRNQYRVIISQSKIYDDLVRLGVEPNKSLICKFPTEQQLPIEFVNSFILGYFDGDGSISRNPRNKGWKICFTGTLDFVEKIREYLLISQNILTHHQIILEKRTGNGKIYYLNINGTCNKKEGYERLEKIYKLMYKEVSGPLERKKIKFVNLLNHE
jgi:LAGLIDADG-like domain